MKNLKITLLLLAVSFLSGCSIWSTSSATPTPPPPTPRPTVVLQPEATPTIKPIESQPVETTAVDAPTIAYNQVKEGQIEAPSAVDEWVFNGQAGERVNIVVNSRFDSYLELYAPDGEFVTSNDDSGDSLNAALFDLQLKQTGSHTIVVRGYNQAVGAYALALTGGHPTIGGGTLTSGDSRAVVLSEQGLKWRYEGQKGTFLTVTVESEELVDSYLSLYGPDGTLLTSDDDSGGGLNAEIFEFQLPEDGTYTVQAHTNTETGLVTLALNSSGQTSGGGSIAFGQAQSGTLKPGRVHRWSFTGEAGQIITLSMISADFDTFLELRNSQEAILAENDDSQDSTDSTIELFTLPADDTYTVVARGLSESDGGDYALNLKQVKIPAGGGSLPPDQVTQASLAPGQVDSWFFEAEKGNFVTVTVQSNTLDTYLELYGPDEELLTEDDDSGGHLNAALLDFPLPEDGEYRLVVKPAQEGSNEGGVYDITLTLTESLATTGELVSDEPNTVSLGPGEQHTWTFEAEEDVFVTVRMESATLDTYLSLYDSTGELLALNDDFLGNQAIIANFITPKVDEYRIVARAYSTEEAGDYTISLSLTDEALLISSDSEQPAPEETE